MRLRPFPRQSLSAAAAERVNGRFAPMWLGGTRATAAFSAAVRQPLRLRQNASTADSRRFSRLCGSEGPCLFFLCGCSGTHQFCGGFAPVGPGQSMIFPKSPEPVHGSIQVSTTRIRVIAYSSDHPIDVSLNACASRCSLSLPRSSRLAHKDKRGMRHSPFVRAVLIEL